MGPGFWDLIVGRGYVDDVTSNAVVEAEQTDEFTHLALQANLHDLERTAGLEQQAEAGAVEEEAEAGSETDVVPEEEEEAALLAARVAASESVQQQQQAHEGDQW
jgi:hypothetical protein